MLRFGHCDHSFSGKLIRKRLAFAMIGWDLLGFGRDPLRPWRVLAKRYGACHGAMEGLLTFDPPTHSAWSEGFIAVASVCQLGRLAGVDQKRRSERQSTDG